MRFAVGFPKLLLTFIYQNCSNFCKMLHFSMLGIFVVGVLACDAIFCKELARPGSHHNKLISWIFVHFSRKLLRRSEMAGPIARSYRSLLANNGKLISVWLSQALNCCLNFLAFKQFYRRSFHWSCSILLHCDKAQFRLVEGNKSNMSRVYWKARNLP